MRSIVKIGVVLLPVFIAACGSGGGDPQSGDSLASNGEPTSSVPSGESSAVLPSADGQGQAPSDTNDSTANGQGSSVGSTGSSSPVSTASGSTEPGDSPPDQPASDSPSTGGTSPASSDEAGGPESPTETASGGSTTGVVPPTEAPLTVSGAAVVRAIVAGEFRRGILDETTQDRFSSLWINSHGGYEMRSYLTPKAATDLEGWISLTLLATFTPGEVTFDGSGIVFSFANGVQYHGELTGNSYAIPGVVPMDKTLHQWTDRNNPDYWVRLFVGSVDGDPDIMRVCLNQRFPGFRRVTCGRHLRANGDFVGADVVHDVNGEVFQHVTDDREPAVKSVLLCRNQRWVGNSWQTQNQAFQVAQFDGERLFVDGWIWMHWNQADDGQVWFWEQTLSGNVTRYRRWNAFESMTVDVDGSRVTQIEWVFGSSASQRRLCETA